MSKEEFDLDKVSEPIEAIQAFLKLIQTELDTCWSASNTTGNELRSELKNLEDKLGRLIGSLRERVSQREVEERKVLGRIADRIKFAEQSVIRAQTKYLGK